ncbi:MAG: TRAP transporter large permease subunit [Gammaproteobacteria bacterium]|nr:TRAP transporter large permease subunit [Gammaproteobacteria bacterium]
MTLVCILFALFGAPLFAVIAAAALAGFHSEGVDLSVVAIEIYRLAETPVLLAIPLFTFAGYVLGESGAPQRLVRLSNALLGWLPGGLAIVAVVTCALFTAFTGASGVTIVALGALLYPALKQAGYRPRFGLGLVTSSGSLGILFAPSLPLILYGVVAQSLGARVNIDDLFVAGILPGTLMLVLLAGYCMLQTRDGSAALQAFSRVEAWRALRASMPEIPLPFIVLGGIYGGYLAVSEAAAVTALYVLLVEVAMRREIEWARLPAVMRESMTLVGGILIILGVSLASTNYMIDTELPTRIFDTIREYIDDKLTFLIALNVFLLVLGMMLDIFSALVIMIPIILPIALDYGVNPLHLGIVFLANMQLGYFTPPVGMNLFIASYRFDKSIVELCLATWPFFLLLLIAVAVITYWPALSTALL